VSSGVSPCFHGLGGESVGGDGRRRADATRLGLSWSVFSKLPHYPTATTAFQRLSYAYKTLSKPETRRMYDLGGMQRMPDGESLAQPSEASGCTCSSWADLGWWIAGGRSSAADDENLNGLVWGVFDEFINGDFEMIRNAISKPTHRCPRCPALAR
jgi:curved DNA-binding protein CbpA